MDARIELAISYAADNGIDDLAEQARQWHAECAGCYTDFSDDDAEGLSDREALVGIVRHYDGGIAAFVVDCNA